MTKSCFFIIFSIFIFHCSCLNSKITFRKFTFVASNSLSELNDSSGYFSKNFYKTKDTVGVIEYGNYLCYIVNDFKLIYINETEQTLKLPFPTHYVKDKNSNFTLQYFGFDKYTVVSRSFDFLSKTYFLGENDLSIRKDYFLFRKENIKDLYIETYQKSINANENWADSVKYICKKRALFPFLQLGKKQNFPDGLQVEKIIYYKDSIFSKELGRNVISKEKGSWYSIKEDKAFKIEPYLILFNDFKQRVKVIKSNN